MSAVDDDRDPPEDYIDDYLGRLERWGKSPSTVENYRYALKYLDEFLDDLNQDVDDVTREEANEFITYMLDTTSLQKSTAVPWIKLVSEFYSYYSDEGFFEVNPLSKPLKNRSQQLKYNNNVHRREISINEMSEFIRGLEHPFDEAVVMTFAKTGKRVGEVVNLDVRDINLDHSGFKREYPALRSELEDRQDTIYFANKDEISERKETNGEIRDSGNKSENAALYPVDPELKQALLRWFAIRPPSPSPADPVFTAQTGERATNALVYNKIMRLAKPQGWYTEGAGYGKNVTPHYFRSWWGTHFEPRVKDRGLVKYLRGDAGDIVDQYRENWGGDVNQKYLNNIYEFY